MGGKGACLVCGKPLKYLEKAEAMECVFCHEVHMSNGKCEDNHYICDECHGKKGIEAIKDICLESGSRNPLEIAFSIMKNPYIHMHGPEHHVLAGASLLTAYANSGGNIEIESALDEMAIRGQQVPGGVCGFHGCCGAAVSTGIYYSIITGCSPLHEVEWKRANLMTAASLTAIAEYGGPRCCKRDSFLAIKEAVDFTYENLGIQMGLQERMVCGFFRENEQCLKKRCPFYPAVKREK